MTNPKTRKTGNHPQTTEQHQTDVPRREESHGVTEAWGQLDLGDGGSTEVDDENSLTPTPTDAAQDNEEEDDDSSSSFSLQECINEFHARRIRRVSTQSREVPAPHLHEPHTEAEAAELKKVGTRFNHVNPADADLIDQNRSNKEHERKCKPCQNGFCYCFTSDSGDNDGGGGDGGCTAANGQTMARAVHVRHSRRSRKSESSQICYAASPFQQHHLIKPKEKRGQSAPASFKTLHKSQNAAAATKAVTTFPPTASGQKHLTAISRLQTTSPDAPLIHIIQELHNDCVISEVRINKHKIQQQQRQQQRSQSLNAKSGRNISSPKKSQHFQLTDANLQYSSMHTPTAPPEEDLYSPLKNKRQSAPSAAAALHKISEFESYSSTPHSSSLLDTSSKSNDSGGRRHKHKNAGRLLQKRLSNSNIQVKPLNFNQPPPKPPRSSHSFDYKSTISSLASTSPSVREAERVLDEFLRKRGVKVPGHCGEGSAKQQHQPKTTQKHLRNKTIEIHMEDQQQRQEALKRDKRKSLPLIPRQPLPSCPSLSDLERIVDTKKSGGNYEKNIRHIAEKPVKELSFGWREPKISEMLNYDANANGSTERYKSKAVQAEPQQSVGWQIPHKIDLDTVDGVVRHNLAAHMETKNTPIKSRIFSVQKPKGSTQHASDSQKFMWGEQLRNLSPWTHKKQSGSGSGNHKHRKSNLKSSSCAFLNSSKKKILRLVSPKKDNKERGVFERKQQTPLRTIGIQTSPEDLRSYELSLTPQSPPPGSYHSAVQTSQQSSTTTVTTNNTTTTRSQNTNDDDLDGVVASQFDFTRTVQSPPKKTPRSSSQRKLQFPINSGSLGACISCNEDGRANAATKTYRSYHSDFDQDVTLSKMGYILSNIRAKLEASDEHAQRTFQEIESREQQKAASFENHPDNHNIRLQTRVDRHGNQQRACQHYEPIYSEIEEDSIHISESPNFDNKTGHIQHFSAESNPEAIYAKVNKIPKGLQALATSSSSPTPLGQLLHESLKDMRITPPPITTSFPPRPSEPLSSDVSYVSPSPLSPDAALGMSIFNYQSLNNIRVMEQHSPPKKNRNLSKSDLSLHRSEIFLENLCSSEICIDPDQFQRLQKVENDQKLNQSYISLPSHDESHSQGDNCATPDDYSISYELPNDIDSNAAGSQLGLSSIAPPQTHNQSTPKKQRPASQQQQQTFLTKLSYNDQLDIAISDGDDGDGDGVDDVSDGNDMLLSANVLQNQSSSCPTTPRKLPAIPDEVPPHAASLNEIYTYPSTNPLSNTTLARYKRLKNALRKSLRKSKNFVKSETKRLSTSLSFPAPNTQSDVSPRPVHSASSSFNLDTLFNLDDAAPVAQQLATAVSICRQLPDLEISPEMVEAERLLLFSTLRREARKQKLSLVQMPQHPWNANQSTRRFFIDAMRLPIKADTNQDIFFNYFYIVTFECGGVVRSTQSVECRNREAIFCDCGIEFVCNNDERGGEELEVRCEIFMLRLRKISTLSLEPRKPIVITPNLLTPNTTASASSSASSSCDEIVSRFRLHACFTLNAINFAPYEYVERESHNPDNRICLRASSTCNLPLTPRTRSTNLTSEIKLTGRSEVRFPKRTYSGFLNVQDPHTLHSWNRRWCTLNGLHVSIWQDSNDMTEHPLLSLDLCQSIPAAPLVAAPRELCARPRSFCLQCVIRKADEVVDRAAVFCAAETQTDFQTWLEHLNTVLNFINNWMQ